MVQLTTLNADLIMTFRPCGEWPEERVRPAVPQSISVVQFLRVDHIPAEDKLWVVLREEFLSERVARLFLCDCAERALYHERAAGREPDRHSWNAVIVARRFANGEATSEELAAARDASARVARTATLVARARAARAASVIIAATATARCAMGAAAATANDASVTAMGAAAVIIRVAASATENEWLLDRLQLLLAGETDG